MCGFSTLGHRDCVAIRSTWSPGRTLLIFLILFLRCVGARWLSCRPAFKAHISCVRERRVLAARHPPGRIYGVAALSSSSQLLESLAAAEAAPLVLKSSTWIEEGGTLNLIWMPLHGVRWFLCCRQGFSLLGRDYGEKEEEESFELRNKDDLTPSGRVTIHLHYTRTRTISNCIYFILGFAFARYVDDVTLQKPKSSSTGMSNGLKNVCFKRFHAMSPYNNTPRVF